MKIIKFNDDKNLFNKFLDFSNKVYENDPFYLPNIPSSNKNFTFFLVEDNEEILGRACAIINSDIDYHDKKVGLIGYFDSIDDQKVFDFLINNIKNYFKEKGIDFIIGPINENTWNSYRITEPDKELPFFLDNYNKTYYADFFRNYKFKEISHYYSSKVINNNYDYSKLLSKEDKYNSDGIKFRNINLNKIDEEFDILYNISLEGFKDNFLYTPIEKDVFVMKYKKISDYIDPNYVIIVSNKEDKPIAFMFAIHNFYQKKYKSMILKSIAVLPEYRGIGLGSFLIKKIHKTAFENGYDELIHALMFEKNISMKFTSDRTDIFRTYTLFGLEI